MSGKRATVVAAFRKIDSLNTRKRVSLMIATFVVVVSLLEIALVQLGHVELPFPSGGETGTAVGE